MNYIQGRENLAATIHVPTNCTNNCPFCVNKHYYKDLKISDEYNKWLDLIAESNIDEIVITGGEPTQDLGILQQILDKFKDKIVYINTSLPKKNFEGFLDIIEKNRQIEGISISRHTSSEEEEGKLLLNVVDDAELKRIKVPVRINVVLTEDKPVEDILARWENTNFILNLRWDYTQTTKDTLHTLDYLPKELWVANLVSKTGCNVCSTMAFKKEDQFIAFHKGLEYTSIKLNNGDIEVNDFILFPDGTFSYDWSNDSKVDIDIFKSCFNNYK